MNGLRMAEPIRGSGDLVESKSKEKIGFIRLIKLD